MAMSDYEKTRACLAKADRKAAEEAPARRIAEAKAAEQRAAAQRFSDLRDTVVGLTIMLVVAVVGVTWVVSAVRGSSKPAAGSSTTSGSTQAPYDDVRDSSEPEAEWSPSESTRNPYECEVLALAEDGMDYATQQQFHRECP